MISMNTRGTGFLFLTMSLLLAGCGAIGTGGSERSESAAASPAQASYASVPPADRLLDMTYPFDENSIYWPNARSFRLEKGDWGPTPKGYFYAANEYGAAEHGGTHLDAPIHFAENRRTMEQIPVSELIGPAVKLDVTSACARNRDYLLQVTDIERWERVHGRVPRGAWVIMYTGIGTRHYPDRKEVLGTDIAGENAIPHLSFPGFSPEAAQWLLDNREITGVAIDTPSIDYGKSTDFRVHQILYEANKLGLENIANLDKLPDAGAVLYVMPMLIRHGTGAPARVFAVLP
jgi:kynurenine formamidase